MRGCASSGLSGLNPRGGDLGLHLPRVPTRFLPQRQFPQDFPTGGARWQAGLLEHERTLKSRWPGPLPPQGQNSQGQGGAQDGRGPVSVRLPPLPPRRHLLALAHPLTGLLTPPSSWLILTLPGLQSRCPPTTPPTPIQREDLMPEARIAGGWGQAGRRSLVILGQRSGSWMGTSQAEKVSSLGKDWHKFCLKCERCGKTLTPGGHAEHDGKPFCHKPCYATLFGPKGVNIGGAGSYIYEKPSAEGPQVTGPIEVPAARAEERKASGPPKGPSKASSVTTFTGEPNMCPRCNKRVYFAEKVTSLGKDWHRPCLRCERCGKTLTPGGHAEHDGQPYCHKPCYGILFGPRGVNTGAVGSYIYDRDPEGKVQP